MVSERNYRIAESQGVDSNFFWYLIDIVTEDAERLKGTVLVRMKPAMKPLFDLLARREGRKPAELGRWLFSKALADAGLWDLDRDEPPRGKSGERAAFRRAAR